MPTTHKQQYEQLKEGRNSDEVIRDKMRQIEESINGYYAKEKNYCRTLRLYPRNWS